MTGSQFVIYAAMLMVAFVYIRKLLMKRGVNQYDAPSVAAKLKAKDNILLLDVRTSGERSRRQIRESLHIPLHELNRRVHEMDRFKDKEIICYCQSGSRSLSAAQILKRHGFRVANLSGGISSWIPGE